MRKLLGLIGALGLVASSSSIVVSCGSNKKDDLDLSKAMVYAATADGLGSQITITKDKDNASNYTGSITADVTIIEIMLSDLATDQKAKAISVSNSDTKVMTSSTDSTAATGATEFSASPTAYSEDDQYLPYIEAQLFSGNFVAGNIAVIAFTFDGMNESTISLTVVDQPAIDISAAKVSSDIDTTPVALSKDDSNDSNFTGTITAGATDITLDFSALTAEQKANEINVNQNGTKVLATSTATDAPDGVMIDPMLTKYDKDDNTTPSIRVCFDGNSTQKAFAEGNIVKISFEFAGMKESIVTLIVQKGSDTN